MTDPLIRTARQNDLQQLLQFEQAVIAAERPFAQNLKDAKIHYYDLPQLIESDNSELAVLHVEQQIVGCGYAQIRASAPHHNSQQHCYLGFMYTVPDYRGRGLNQQLIDYLQEWSLAREVRHFRLDVYSDNQAAIRAYQKAGFSVHMAEMVKQL